MLSLRNLKDTNLSSGNVRTINYFGMNLIILIQIH